jgi:hypothetical protein|tara:strand:- start:8 stop:208 length:201 start_codon:yes stop_codon:yes gene_type:complete
MSRYIEFRIDNNDVITFMNWYRNYLKYEKKHTEGSIVDTLIHMVGNPHKYDDDYQKFRAEKGVINE